MNKQNIIKGLKWFFHSYIWIGVLLLIVDIVSKNIIANTMQEGESITLIPGFLSISYAINRHAAFGIGPEDPNVSRILYICFASIASVGISIWFAKSHKKMPGYVRAALMIIVAGALGATYGTDKLFAYLQKLGIDLAAYGLDPQTVSIAVMVAIIVAGVFVMLWSGVAIASGVLGLLARKKQSKALYIANAVFSTLAGVIVNGVGGVMGMFTLPKEE